MDEIKSLQKKLNYFSECQVKGGTLLSIEVDSLC